MIFNLIFSLTVITCGVLLHPVFLILMVFPTYFMLNYKSLEKFQEPPLPIYRAEKQAYLKSVNWESLRFQVLSRDNFTCTKCGVTNVPLHVHHISYKNLFNEPLEDLASVCEICHSDLHNTYGFPQSVQEYNKFYAPIKD